jgi:hypothetical protein
VNCEKKMGYTSRKHAEEIRRRREKRGGEPLRVYFCRLHGRWHLTHENYDATQGKGNG